ncbi:isopentenyl-diphosphate delta-isomerase [Verruconis gallopava]|uniref:isopentenyl-diphosphate Delta-isomerase n=1 Tax=Verruconis gallopava TaxID=253628 RepID=A0A0D2A288_9PEZI|nr:isopentenyl-diphosphate delta-isomerase [Verruconis gallopava]KIW00440.1 isopentenyl-diphosphate delta-isomerase [Verruconis gallopava]
MSVTTTVTAREPITADNVLRLFGEQVNTAVIGTRRSEADDAELQGYDEEQIRLMDEVCIVLDENDSPIGSASKKTCHLMTNINQGLLHRAFSVFLFDQDNRLLLQQRATEKITFPDMWTNTCCSHPLGIPGETGDTLETSVLGVKRAAQRKLEHELGIRPESVPIDEFNFLTRIHYLAPSDGKWGEHEIDYILFIKPSKGVELNINPNEVRDTKYVSQEELKAMFKDKDLKFTPWFKLICESMLFEWWSNLDSGLEKYMNEATIRRML